MAIIKKVSLRDIIDENAIPDEEKEYNPGKCGLCGKDTLIDQNGYCEDCGKRLVQLKVPLLTIVPIPYIPINIDIKFGDKSAWEFIKDTFKKK